MSTNMTTLLRALAFLLTFALLAAHAHAQPVRLNPASTVIVTPDPAIRECDQAAGLLRAQLRRIYASSAGFDIVPDKKLAALPPDDNRFFISIGPTSLLKNPLPAADLAPDGYAIVRAGNTLTLQAADETGLFLSAPGFLDKLAGVRFYLPGEDFASLPKNPWVEFDQVNIKTKPFVTSCFLSGINVDDAPAAQWARINAGWRRKGGTHQHNLYEIFPPEKHAQTSPEIYPIREGKRYIPKSKLDQEWQINFLEPKTLVIAQESILAYFAARPTDQYVALSINDGRNYSQDDATNARIQQIKAQYPGDNDAIDRATSQIYWEFINKLALSLLQKAPGKRLVCLAYGPTRFPPTFKLPDNVVVFTNLHIGELPADGFLVKDASGASPLDRWLAVANHFGNHDWYQGSGYLIPRIYSNYNAQFMRALKQSASDAYMHTECYPNWGLDGPKLWVLTRLWWDPTLDPAALTTQFCDDLFGPAAKPMNDYFNLLETLWTQLNITDGPERKLMRWDSQFRTSPASMAIIAQCRKHLDQALLQAQNDPLARKRITLFSDCFGFSERLFTLAASVDPSPQQRKDIETYINEKVLIHPLSLHHKNTAMLGLGELFWNRLRASARPFTVPSALSPTPGKPGPIPTAPPVGPWSIRTASTDPGQTTAAIAADDQWLYLTVQCPHPDTAALVETTDTSWRSDNIECFIDLDSNRDAYERQFWVKTSGRLVDFKGSDKPGIAPIASVVKQPRAYTVHIAIPRAYLPAADPSQLGILIVRNEFKPVQNVNQLNYTAVWSAILKLPWKNP
jgi:hypothetical protein